MVRRARHVARSVVRAFLLASCNLSHKVRCWGRHLQVSQHSRPQTLRRPCNRARTDMGDASSSQTVPGLPQSELPGLRSSRFAQAQKNTKNALKIHIFWVKFGSQGDGRGGASATYFLFVTPMGKICAATLFPTGRTVFWSQIRVNETGIPSIGAD